MAKRSPQIRTVELLYKGRKYSIEYFIRPGEKGTILLIHGLGGAKENYWEALKSDELGDYCLVSFDNPGTGNSTYHDDFILDIDDLAEITSLFIQKLDLRNFILTGSSMGGLTTLLYLKNNGAQNVKGYINIEGNLMPEDCMFSSKVVVHNYDYFANDVFPQIIKDMKKNGNPGYHIIANNLELNTNVKSYFQYSFQTVQYSSTGELLTHYMNLDIPRVFIYGEKNKGLSYISQLKQKGLQVRMISNSDHFIFYDNPKELYQSIAEFATNLSKRLK